MHTDVLYAVPTQHFKKWIRVLLVIEDPAAGVRTRRIELQAVNLDRFALVDQRFDRRGAVGRVDSPEHADARRGRADKGCLARWKKIDAVKRRTHPETIQKGNVGFAAEKDVLKEHDAPHIGDRHRMADDPGARARERFEEMLPPLAHLTDTAGAPPHMGLGVDEDRWAGRVAICNSLSRGAIGVALGSGRSMWLALP